MATLESIRKRSGLLIIVIGFAMAAFILTDLLGSGGSLFTDYNSVGEVDGKKIARNDFSVRMDEIKNSNPQYANLSSKQLADFAWNMMLRDELMGSEFDKLGMVVTSDELYFDIVNNPQIQQNFTDPSTGQFNENGFKQTIASIREQKDQTPEAREQWNSWINFERGVKEQSLIFKYNTAVEKGLYTPKAFAELNYVASAQTYQTDYIQLLYSSIVDSTVDVSASDKKSYYNAHKEDFKQEAVRNIEYINFVIAPSAKDKAEISNELSALLKNDVKYNANLGKNDTLLGFAETKNDSAFVAQHSDLPVDMSYHTAGTLAPNLDSLMFNNEVGYTFGPYTEGDGYAVSKLSAITTVPDSVKARHILIAYQGAERAGDNVTRAPQEAQAIADSLFKLIKADPSEFEAASTKMNDDAVASTKGGDLGYFSQGSMAQPFNDYCFYNETGDVGLVYTNFGIHIIEITAQKGDNKAVRVATIYRDVLSSDETIKEIYNQASSYASEAQRAEDYTALAEEKGLQLRPATDIKEFDDQIPGVGSSRKIVQWAWNLERKEGDIGLIDNNGQSYVVVVLTDAFEEGYTPIEKVDEKLTREVIKVKKGEMLTAKLAEASKGQTDLKAIAAALNTQTKSQNFNRQATTISGVGNEPKVIGQITGSATGVISAPVAGQGAAYLFTVIQVNEAFAKPDYANEINTSTTSLRGRVANQLFEALKSGAKIEDNRALFY